MTTAEEEIAGYPGYCWYTTKRITALAGNSFVAGIYNEHGWERTHLYYITPKRLWARFRFHSFID